MCLSYLGDPASSLLSRRWLGGRVWRRGDVSQEDLAKAWRMEKRQWIPGLPKGGPNAFRMFPDLRGLGKGCGSSYANKMAPQL